MKMTVVQMHLDKIHIFNETNINYEVSRFVIASIPRTTPIYIKSYLLFLNYHQNILHWTVQSVKLNL
jgi:hypothetical protein